MSHETFAESLVEARLLLRAPEPATPVWPALLAALAFAVCALGFAMTAILAPPVHLTPVPALRSAD